MNKPMRRLFKHIARLKLLVLFILVNSLYSYSQGIELKRVSIEQNNLLQIYFELDDPNDIVESIALVFYPDISNPNIGADTTQIILNEHPHGFAEINNPAGANYAQQMHFRLWVEDIVSQSKIHSAIFLDSIESLSEACEVKINATWSNYAIYTSFDPYIPQESSIFDTLQVLMYHFGEVGCMTNTETIIAEYAQTLADNERVIELAEDIASGGETYCFRIRSINSKDTTEYSYSNMQVVDLPELLIPKRPFITAVDVKNNLGIEIRVDVDDDGFSLFEYILQRSDNPDFGFVGIDRSMHIESHLTFDDNDIPHFDNHPWYYRVVADILDCPMDPPRFSDILSSVFLSADVNFDYGSENEVEVDLTWDHYHIDGVYEYTLIKQLDGGSPTRFSNLAENSYIDILQLDQLGAEVKYIVEAIRTGSTIPPVHSNYFLFSPEWLKPPPNAFRPGSTIEANQKFIPEFYFETGITGYSLSIFDRNGLRLFYSEQTGEGWNGEINRQPAPAGAYIYVIEFDQAEKPKRGVVYLVR